MRRWILGVEAWSALGEAARGKWRDRELRSGVGLRLGIVRLAIRGEGSPCALRGRLGEKPTWLSASESLGLDSYCG